MAPGKPASEPTTPQAESPASIALTPPAVSLPKGGGAVRGIGEKFAANPVTGTGAMSVPIALSPGRSGFGPQLALAYDSGAGNGPFGLGWTLALPAIARKTDKGLPTYLDAQEADTFVLWGAEDLVPALAPGGTALVTQAVRLAGVEYQVHSYVPRVEAAFMRIERWCPVGAPETTCWRTVSRDNVTSWYGRDTNSRIADPADPRRIFQWLICQSSDGLGNVMVFDYVADAPGQVVETTAWEGNRQALVRGANRYPKRVRYGNLSPYMGRMYPDQAEPLPTAWMFEAVFDYGEHHPDTPSPQPLPQPPHNAWRDRPDAFSNHRPGFELRTYRLCRRVLMFHHFPGEAGVGADCLVRATEFEHALPTAPAAPDQPGYTTLRAVVQRSYQRQPGSQTAYLSRSMPPLSFTYSKPKLDPVLRSIDAAQLPNLPAGTQGSGYQWIDLDGEGLSGVLAELPGGWYYKSNLGGGRFGPLREVATRPALAVSGGGHQFIDLAGDGTLDMVDFSGPVPGFHARDAAQGWRRHVPFASLPHINWQDPNLRFVDLTGDGHADALLTEDDVFTWYPSLDERGFAAARRQPRAADDDSGPRLVFADVVQTIFLADMCGDGLTDLVRIRNGEVCYWPNLGHGRFGRKVTLGNAPRFDHPEQFDPARIRLADIDGSGPVDIIYLGRSGADLYFNRSGNQLSNALGVALPLATDNLATVQVADLLGNGTACLVWNSPLPADAGRPVQYIDLMAGPRADAQAEQAQARHDKPHLLIAVDNHLGSRTEIEYTPSTRFYLQDRQAGTPWLTQLPFPVHCVSRITVRDQWRRTVFSSSYSYHHGYFDGAEREFRGFGRVEQVDTQTFADVALANAGSAFITPDTTLYQAPVKTVSWFHTGAAAHREQLLGLYADEYLPTRRASDFAAAGFAEPVPAAAEIDPGNGAALDADEWREAMRACKGAPLRQEVFELDAQALAASGQHLPVRFFSASQHGHHVRRVQPRGANRHAVFLVLPGESFTCHYELDLRPRTLDIDPRVAQTLNLSFDAYGNLLQSVAVVYPRRKVFADASLTPAQQQRIRDVQAERRIACTELRFTEPLAPGLEHHRLPLPCETRTYALSGADAATGFVPSTPPYFGAADFRAFALSDRLPGQGTKPVVRLQYHQQPTSERAHQRLVQHTRTLYWNDASAEQSPTQALPFGAHGPRGLKFEDYQLALTDTLLDSVFHHGAVPAGLSADLLAWTAIPASGNTAARSARELLRDPAISGYSPGSALGMPAGQYWVRSGTAGFGPDAHLHYFLPGHYTDAFGKVSSVQHDGRDLFVRSCVDARGNTMSVLAFDCRVLAPSRLRDANHNVSEVAFDVHGSAVASAVLGKVVVGPVPGTEITDTGDSVAALGFDDLNPEPGAVAAFFAAASFDEDQARRWLGQATARHIHHFGEGRDAAGDVTQWALSPAAACSLAREQHERQQPNRPNLRIALQVAVAYADGAAQAFVTKLRAEPESPGGAARWISNGKTIHNNKGKPVLQFEPYFSDGGHRFQEPLARGVSPVMFYDAAGRLVRTLHADGSLSRVLFSPWFSRSFDANDTVLDAGNRWYAEHSAASASAQDRRAAALAALHADTPAEVHLDSLGREVVAIAHNATPQASNSSNANTPLPQRNWVHERHGTYSKLDAEGNPLWVRDALGNLVMQCITPAKPTRWDDDATEDLPAGSVPGYDMAGHLLFQHSMDAGPRWTLMDAAGQPMLAWDFNDRGPNTAAQGRLYRTEYDTLRRAIATWLQFDNQAPALVDATVYCDTDLPRDADAPIGLDAARARNLIGQSVSHHDPSGVATVRSVDLCGQPAHITRRLTLADAGAADGLVDWSGANRNSLLDAETFEHITAYDALGRTTRRHDWHRGSGSRVAVHEARYNERGLLQATDLVVRAHKTNTGDGHVATADTTRTTVIAAIDYDAKGQKLSLALGNGTSTRYTYDAQNLRLVHLHTRRGGAAFGGDCASAHTQLPQPPRPCGVQNLHFSYDAAGNLMHVQDDAQNAVFFQGQFVEPSSDYLYDALYRLIEATGRENAVALAPPRSRESPWPSGDFPSADALRNYRQRFVYDAAGNFVEMAHLPAAGNGWTRHYSTQSDSNRLRQTWYGGSTLDAVTYHHDAHGNMLNLNRVEPPRDANDEWGLALRWDWRDMLLGLDLGGGGQARYHYGIDKQRTRKHITRLGGVVEDRIDLGGYELYRRRNAQGQVVEEIESLHVFEGEQRVLLVDDVFTTDAARPDGLAVQAQTLFRYQYGNHLGSVGLELDAAARVISYEEFHPYGTTAYRLMDTLKEAPPKRYRYTGMERDEESGLGRHGARALSCSIAKWISPDPLGATVDANVYRYCFNNPLSLVDTDGMAPKKKVSNAFRPNSPGTRKDNRAAYEATTQVLEGRGRAVVGKEWQSSPSSRHDGVHIRENDGGDPKTAEDTTQRVNRYRRSDGDLDEGKLQQRAQTKLDQVEKHQNSSGVGEELFVWLKGQFSKGEGGRVKAIWKTEGAKRGISVTVGSLAKFLKSGNAAKSTLGAAVGFFAFLRGSSAEASEGNQAPRQASAAGWPGLPTQQEIVDEVIPDEVQLLVTGAELALHADSLAPATSQKAFDLAYVANGNLRRVGLLPLVIDIETGDLFGLETTVLGGGSGYPGQLTALGRMEGIPRSMFLSADQQMVFSVDEGNNWSLRVRDPESNTWHEISR